MLSALILGFVVQQDLDSQPFPTKREAEAIAALAKLGYRYISAGVMPNHGRSNDPHDGSVLGGLARRGSTVRVWINGGLFSSLNGEIPVDRIDLSFEFPALREVPFDGMTAQEDVSHDRIYAKFTPHLGKTVDFNSRIHIDRGDTYGDVRRKLDEVWTLLESYAKEHEARLVPVAIRDWRKYRFDDAVVLRAADPASIERVATSWGWQDDHPIYLGIRPIWAFPIRVHGVAFDLMQSFEQDDMTRNTSFQAYTANSFRLRKGLKPTAWAANVERRYPFLDASTRGIRSDVSLVFRLKDGMSLREIRRQLETAADVAKAARTPVRSGKRS